MWSSQVNNAFQFLFVLCSLFSPPSDIGVHVTSTPMAHKSHKIFQRLSSKSQAPLNSKACYTWHSRTKHKALQLMPAEKAQRAKSCHVHQQDYKSALSEAQATIMAEAMKLWEQFGGHSVDCYYKEIIQCSQLNCGWCDGTCIWSGKCTIWMMVGLFLFLLFSFSIWKNHQPCLQTNLTRRLVNWQPKLLNNGIQWHAMSRLPSPMMASRYWKTSERWNSSLGRTSPSMPSMICQKDWARGTFFPLFCLLMDFKY